MKRRIELRAGSGLRRRAYGNSRMRWNKLWNRPFHINRLELLLNGLVILTSIKTVPGQMIEHGGIEWIELDAEPALGEGLFGPSHGNEKVQVLVVCVAMDQRALKFNF